MSVHICIYVYMYTCVRHDYEMLGDVRNSRDVLLKLPTIFRRRVIKVSDRHLYATLVFHSLIGVAQLFCVYTRQFYSDNDFSFNIVNKEKCSVIFL